MNAADVGGTAFRQIFPVGPGHPAARRPIIIAGHHFVHSCGGVLESEDDPHLVVRRQAPVGQSPRDLLPRCVPGLIDLDILFAMLFGGRFRSGRRRSSQLRSDQERGRYDHRILGALVRIARVIQPRTPQRIFARRSRDPDMVHAEIIVVIDIVERPAIGVGRPIPPPSRTVLLPGIAADSSAVIDGFRFEKAVGSRPLLG